MMKFTKLVLIFGFFVFISLGCKNNASLPTLDLMKYGLPIEIKAPEGAEVVVDDMGFMKDCTVKAGENYSLQIVAGDAIETKAAVVTQKQKELVQKQAYFKEIVQEDEHGFIYKKDIDGKEDYDFRYIRISGDKEYIFQTGLMGTFSLEDVKAMYESVKE